MWPLFALLAVLAARRWLDVVEVRGRSMAPTLLPGDRLLVVRAEARVGDVVLAADPRAPGRELIKRVAAAGRLGLRLHGDNRAASTDARAFGPIAPHRIAWRAVLRYWPLERAGRLPPPPSPSPVGDLYDEGGESACTYPQALIAGD